MPPLLKSVAAAVLRSAPFRLARAANGDWRYIYLPIAWKLAALLVRRRRIRMGAHSFTVQCDNEITHFRWFKFKTREPETIDFIDQHIGGGDVFFDVGANIGVFSLYAAARHKDLRVVAFEPEFSNLHYLKENVLANGLGERIGVFGIALGDGDGLSTLHLQDTTPGAAVHTESRDDIATTAEGYAVTWREGIATATLDSACAHLNMVPAALKIDTDGNEAKVLAGGKLTLADPRLRAVTLEMPPAARDQETCRALLRDAGFALAWSRPTARNQTWVREVPDRVGGAAPGRDLA